MDDATGTLISMGSGGVAGSISAIAGVSVAAAEGAVGAAALTSGLAGVGTLVGGGMAAGLGVVACAPLLGAGACYGIYRIIKKVASK